MQRIIVLILVIASGLAILQGQSPDEIKARIDLARQELADSLASAKLDKSLIPISYPVPKPKSEFETTAEYQQRLIQDYFLPVMRGWPRFTRIDSLAVTEVKSRLARLRGGTFVTSALTVYPNQFNADKELWKMTVLHQEYKRESLSIELKIPPDKAKSLNAVWDRVIVRGQLGFDYNDEVVLIRLVLVNPDTREVFTHNLENLKLMYNTSIIPADKWFGFSPDGKYLVNMGRYNLNDCWEVRDPLSLQSLGSEFVEYHMTPPAFSPDNTFMASIDGSDANAITVHTLPDARTFLTLKGGRMRAMVFSPDSRFLIYYNDEYTQEFGRQKALKIRDLYKKYSATLYNPKHDVSSLALTPDGRFLIIGLDDYVGYTEVLKMDLNTLEIVDRCQVSGVTGIHFSPDRSLMGLTYDDRSSYSALIVTLDGFKTVSKIPVGLFHEFAFSPDGKYALTLRHRIRIHDIFSTDEVYKSQESPSFNVTSFYPDQRYVFLGPWIDRTYLDIPIPELSELLMEE